MAEGVLSAVASRVLESLGLLALEEISSWWGARGDLKKLEKTIRMIEARLHDVERCHEETNSAAIKEWVVRLRRVLYMADDLFDDVFTIDRQKLQVQGKKLGILLQRSGSLSFNRKVARDIKSIRKELDDIKSDMEGLNLRVCTADPLQMPMTRLMMENRETASYVRVDDVIGREIDKNKIIEMLFDLGYEKERVSIIPIVGFGGLGKTTLAQLVFDDERVRKHFEIRKWAYVPDINKLKVMLGKIFKPVTGNNDHDLSLEDLQSGIRESVNNKKYLIVLDDVWDESGDRLLYLMNLLNCGAHGSKVIVTTRSDKVAKVVGTIPEAYKLGVLSDDESWDLFKRLALKSGKEDSKPSLTSIGKEIVERCGNVPLAIRVVGSLLCSNDSEREWSLFRETQFSKANLFEGNNVMHLLKLSYDFLPPQLKQCFAYCSLFPKGHLFYKNEFVHLWMAQGFIQSLHDNQSFDVGDYYFLELLRRNFFQDVVEDDTSNNIRFRMHDLVHDLAQYVAGDETILVHGNVIHLTDRILHMTVVLDPTSSSTGIWEAPPSLLCSMRQMRSFLLRSRNITIEDSTFTGIISRCQSLRALDLKSSGIYRLPDSISRLRHLRYLSLSKNPIKYIPEAILRLVNLQTLNLSYCHHLEELPRGLTRLVNLRHLNIYSCPFVDMPPDFGMMKTLRMLNMFIVGKSNGVDALPALNLSGILNLKFHRWRRDAVSEARRSNLNVNQQLTRLLLDLKFEDGDDAPAYGDVEEMLECFQLPPNLKALSIDGYSGLRFPCWMVDELPGLLPKLVYVRIENCRICKLLPDFSRLPYLKSLYLSCFEALKYIDGSIWSGDGEESSSAECFPSLEWLDLSVMPELIGWSRVENDPRKQLLLPRLSKLRIEQCPNLISMPLVPRLEKFYARSVNGKLLESFLTLPPSTLSTLKQLEISFVHEPFSFPSNLDNLESLRIGWCDSLRSFSGQLQHLSALRKLEISGSEELDVWEMTKDNVRAWKSLKSLHSLSISYNSKLEDLLPDVLGHLTTLQQLEIASLGNLTALPEEIGLLSQLRVLRISGCSKLSSFPQSFSSLSSLQELSVMYYPTLEKRCQQPGGEDLLLIQHIPCVKLGRI